MDLRLNLPDANATIPMKANLPALEPQIQAKWDAEEIYARIIAARAGAPTFVLHDGPPYTNSPIHIGTALNKILKDFVVKSRTLMGYKAPYVPGYDTHGLPIEQAVTKKLTEKKGQFTPDEMRKASREHVAEFAAIQTSQFKRLGVFGLWEKPYKTLDFAYEAEIVRVFKRLVEKNLVYRGLRPTQWSPTLRTALAETEIVYKDHTSKAIYVAFPILKDPNKLFEKFNDLSTIIWTTTPWTIPSNLAVAFHPDMDYAVVRVGEHHFLILEALVLKVAAALEWDDYEVVETLLGINLENAAFEHPIFKRPSIAVMADYVTTEDGTGVVHTAPSHGRDDFFTGQKYGLPVPNTVDEGGVLTAEAGEFAGTYYKKCDTVVVDRLREVGALLKVSDYLHSYPHAERDDQPVIFRATEQWFLSIDPIRTQMLQEIGEVKWIPESGRNRIDAMVRNRPDWCVSRQRAWGVGIPIFYALPSRSPVMDAEIIERVAKVVEQGGSDAWFALSPEEILPAGYAHPVTGETEFTKETDTLDVWFDAGSSSLIVLDEKIFPEWASQGLQWPADIYLEGSDQHRGWFNTSLILATALNGRAPYKTVVTHGFIVDGEGRKISKRLGNGIEPIDASNQYGADILRLWVATVDYTNDAPISDAILKQVGELYRNIRNTLRFLLANAAGYSGPEPTLLPLDEWAVEQADLLVADVKDAYDRYAFGEVVNAVHNFCRETLSKFYLDAIKDRMYCEATDSDLRRSGQAACRDLLIKLTILVTPILAHTADETWTKLQEVAPGADLPESIFFTLFPTPNAARLEEIEGSDLQTRYARLQAVRDLVAIEFEKFRGTDGIKDSNDVLVAYTGPAETLELLQGFGDDLPILLRVSGVSLAVGEAGVAFTASPYEKCVRSRLRRADVAPATYEGEELLLTARDRRVLGL